LYNTPPGLKAGLPSRGEFCFNLGDIILLNGDPAETGQAVGKQEFIK